MHKIEIDLQVVFLPRLSSSSTFSTNFTSFFINTSLHVFSFIRIFKLSISSPPFLIGLDILLLGLSTSSRLLIGLGTLFLGLPASSWFVFHSTFFSFISVCISLNFFQLPLGLYSTQPFPISDLLMETLD